MKENLGMNWVSDPSSPPVMYFPAFSLSMGRAVGIFRGGSMVGGDEGTETTADLTP